jgi:hypothetical protein
LIRRFAENAATKEKSGETPLRVERADRTVVRRFF